MTITTRCNGIESNECINTKVDIWQKVLRDVISGPIMNSDIHNFIKFDDEVVFSMDQFIRQIEKPLVAHFKTIGMADKAYDAVFAIKAGIIEDLMRKACLRLGYIYKRDE